MNEMEKVQPYMSKKNSGNLIKGLSHAEKVERAIGILSDGDGNRRFWAKELKRLSLNAEDWNEIYIHPDLDKILRAEDLKDAFYRAKINKLRREIRDSIRKDREKLFRDKKIPGSNVGAIDLVPKNGVYEPNSD